MVGKMAIMCVAAANHLIELTNQYNQGKPYGEKISMTCKRLQKLLYFSEAEYMKKYNGKPMFLEDFFAWPSGPVIPSVYSKFAQFQTGEMTIVDGSPTSLDSEMLEILDYVFSKTINIDTMDLVEKSHVKDGPWSLVYDDTDPKHKQVIEKKSIYNYYKSRTIFS